MEQYRTEEEQVEALRRWWDENGRSTLAAIIIALSVGFGWQAWQRHDQGQREAASELYQALLQQVGGTEVSAAQLHAGIELGEQLRADYGGTTYAQFAALHLARLAVERGDLADAEAQLRWVLGEAPGGGDTARITQLRLARVLAASGETEQALSILDQSDAGAYQASYAMARGDVLLQQGQTDGARKAYTQALLLASDAGQQQINLPALQAKLQHLNPEVPADVDTAAAPGALGTAVAPAEPGAAAEHELGVPAAGDRQEQ
ncbi:MAG: tetratricopeptide repeat protein [Halioglobus sp.]|nr:tetratricopeptide repeat protein [Halioglobus sp.]